MKERNIFLGRSEVEKIHEATLYLLGKIGVEFENKSALQIFKDHGAKVEGKKVFINRDLLERKINEVPGSFLLQARAPEKNILVGGTEPVFAPAYGPLYVRDGSTRRLALYSDFLNFTRLVETSDILQIANPNICVCQDVPPERRNMYQLAVCLKHSSKPLMGLTSGALVSEECINVVQNFLGYYDQNILLGVISPISPLQYDCSMIEAIMVYAQKSQPLLFSTCSMPGATSPATVASTLVVNNAEILAGIVLSQLICPGLPVIYGNTSVSCDLRYITPAIGSPETGLISMATAALGRYYGIPSRSGGSLTDSKLVDIQAGVESLLTLLPSLIAGVDFILHACGIIESFLTIDYDKFIVDEEIIRTARRLMQSFTIDKQTINLELIKKGGPGANYISETHTFENFKREFYYSRFFSRETFNIWEKKGAPTICEKAREDLNQRVSATSDLDTTAEQEQILTPYL